MYKILCCSFLALTLAFPPLIAHAGARLETGEQSYLEVGLRLQPVALSTERDLDGDGRYDRDTEMKMRRARLRFRFQWNEQLGAFLQTGVGRDADAAGLGDDLRLFDAYVHWKHRPQFQVYAGQLLTPSTRQAMNSTGAMLAGDYSSLAYKSLNYGTRAFVGFANRTYTDSDTGLRGDVFVRDQGLTLFGAHSLGNAVHGKVYLGAYEGIRKAAARNPHLIGRVQVNLLDPEPNYFQKATYLGTLRTLGLGASYSTQEAILEDTDGEEVDYSLFSTDIFLDLPAGPGAVTLETAWLDLDLSSAASVDHDGQDLTAPRDFRRSQGSGYYAQAGYVWNHWQPWLLYESWSSDAEDDKGSFEAYRIGLSYFFIEHQANLKAGYERVRTEAPIGSSSETSIDTLMVGFYLNY